MLFEAITPTEPSPSFLQLRFLFAQLAWFLSEKGLQLEKLDQASLENLHHANELLENHSLVVYANHREKKDALLVISLALKHLPNAHNYIGPAGLKHFDPHRDKLSSTAFKMLRYLHVYALPVLQHNDTVGSRYTPEELSFISNQLRVLSEQLLGQPHMVYGITPEGTRNKDGILTKARNGIGWLEQYHTPTETYYMPLGLIYPPHAEKNTITVGKPVLLPELIEFANIPKSDSVDAQKVRAETITHALMTYLTTLLPIQMHGHYATN